MVHLLGASEPRPSKGAWRRRRLYHGPRYDNTVRGPRGDHHFPAQPDPDLQFLARHFAPAEENFQRVIGPSAPNILAALTGGPDGWYANTSPPATDHGWQIANRSYTITIHIA